VNDLPLIGHNELPLIGHNELALIWHNELAIWCVVSDCTWWCVPGWTLGGVDPLLTYINHIAYQIRPLWRRRLIILRWEGWLHLSWSLHHDVRWVTTGHHVGGDAPFQTQDQHSTLLDEMFSITIFCPESLHFSRSLQWVHEKVTLTSVTKKLAHDWNSLTPSPLMGLTELVSFPRDCQPNERVLASSQDHSWNEMGVESTIRGGKQISIHLESMPSALCLRCGHAMPFRIPVREIRKVVMTC